MPARKARATDANGTARPKSVNHSSVQASSVGPINSSPDRSVTVTPQAESYDAHAHTHAHACRPFNHHRNDMTLLLAQYQVNSRPPSSVCATTQLQLAKTKLAMEQVRIVEEKQRLERLKAESKAPAKPQKTLALGFAGSIGACLIDAWWIFFAHPSRNNCVAILQNLRLDGVIIIIIIIIKPATRRSHSVPSRRTP